MAQVSRNGADARYEIHVDGELAGWLDYVEKDGVISLPHTRVRDEFGGRGLAGELVRAGLDDIRSRGQLIRPVCPYVKAWLRKHPEYGDLVAPKDAGGPGGPESAGGPAN